jgi:8-oxo-dGTP diphosphatase
MQQFGVQKPGLIYRPRPAAFGIAERDGRIAVVHVRPDEGGDWIDLPGGAVDPGEDELKALVREFGEETGLIITPAREVLRAAQYFQKTDGESVNNLFGVYEVTVGGEDEALKIEDDHELVWIPPAEAVQHLRHDSHAWAVAMWWRHR